MGKLSFLKVLSLSISITLILLILRNGGNNELSIERILLTQSDLNTSCSDINPVEYFGASYFNAINNITFAYTNYTINTLDNLTNNKGAQLFTNLVLSIMNNTKVEEASSEYIANRLLPYIIFIIFAVFSLIGLLFYCTCCCCPCRCCKKTDEGNCCRYVSIFMSLFLSASAAVVCIVGLTYSTGFLKSVSALNCAILTFYFDITEGQQTTTTPRWIGIQGISNTLQNMKTRLNSISGSVDGTFNNDSFLDNDPPKYQQTLDTLFTTYSTKTLPNPNPFPSAASKPTVVPSYIKFYGNKNTANTAQNGIAQEYDTTITATKTIVRQIKQYSTAIKQNIGGIQSQLDTVSTQVNSLNSTIDQFSTNVIKSLVNAQSQMKKNGMIIFYIFFGLILGLNVINILGIIMFGCCKVGLFKWFSHLAWFLNAIFMIVTFILGSAFCIFSVFGQDSSQSFLYLFSNTSLAKGDLFGNQANSKIISVCINQDGDLANKYFNLSSSGVDSVAQLYNASLALNQTKNTVSQYQNSIAISRLKSYYQNNTNDVRQVTFPDSDSSTQVAALFESWYGWSDRNRNLQMSSCTSNPAMDLFYQNQADCPSGYTLTNKLDPRSNLGQKSCLLVKSWDSTSVNSRYSSYNCAGNSDFSSASVANNQFWLKMSNFIDQNTQLLNQIISDHDQNLGTQFSGTISSLISLINRVQNLVNPLVDLLQTLVGSNSFYNLINCKFMGIDLQNMLNIFGGEFSTTSKGLGIMILLISFLNAFSVIFTIFMINFSIDPPKSEEVVQEVVQNVELPKQ